MQENAQHNAFNSIFSSQPYTFTFDWEPEIRRLEREVEEAEDRGTGDQLSVAEMECSIDLIDAELLALRANISSISSNKASIDKLSALRCKLLRLIDRMSPLAR